MRHDCLLLLICLAALPARAQVTVDPKALDAIPSPASGAAPAATETRHTRHRAPPRGAGHAQPSGTNAAAPGQAKSATRPGAAPVTGTVRPPVAPPNPAVLPPPVVVVPVRPAPPPPVTIAADAPGAVSPLDHGVRLTFGEGRAELNPAAAASLSDFAHGLPDGATITVRGYAAANGDDPSTPRRLSLQRALAARAELIHEGIASPRIYVRAQGSVTDIAADTGAVAGPPDRADVTMTLPGAGTAGTATPTTRP